MAETMWPAGSQEVQCDPLSNLDRIFKDFWLKLKHRLQQGASQPPTPSCPPLHLPPDPQQELAAQVGPKTVRWRRIAKYVSHPPQAPTVFGCHGPAKRPLSYPLAHHTATRLHQHPQQRPAQPQRGIG
ncbi:Hypothetical predicted protein [Pelobates cultripes]|uniref:Uncharacterized protein n=1 Tax=Pelobates cultripes TaxID=61616 RepID=A0AAD1RHD0_PELCU|nr:Hypothetical predicted protein [Pelobates cultripes]